MQGFRDQISRQYDALVAQTQLEPTIEEPSTSLWLSSSTEDFLTPIRSDTSSGENWLELGEYNEETLLASKGSFKNNFFLFHLFILSDETKHKHDNVSPNPSNDNNHCGTRLFTSAQTTPITTTTHSRQSISSTEHNIIHHSRPDVNYRYFVIQHGDKFKLLGSCNEVRAISSMRKRQHK
jgi:hypothetical protein